MNCLQPLYQGLTISLILDQLFWWYSCNLLLAGLPACDPCSSYRMQQPCWYQSSSPSTSLLHLLSTSRSSHQIQTLWLPYRAVKGSGPSYIWDIVKPQTPAPLLHIAITDQLASPLLWGRPPGMPLAKVRPYAKFCCGVPPPLRPIVH